MPHDTFRKLQWKNQERILVLHAPSEFQPVMDEMLDETAIDHALQAGSKYAFILVFVRSCAEIAENAPAAVAALVEDGLLWFAYPKKSSKKYRSDVGRDDSWQALGDLGFEAVRQIAIDEDWSALRFRQARFIKSMTRDQKRTWSAEGRERNNG